MKYTKKQYAVDFSAYRQREAETYTVQILSHSSGS